MGALFSKKNKNRKKNAKTSGSDGKDELDVTTRVTRVAEFPVNVAGAGAEKQDWTKSTTLSSTQGSVSTTTTLPTPPSPARIVEADEDEEIPGPLPLSRISSTYTLKSESTERSSTSCDSDRDEDDDAEGKESSDFDRESVGQRSPQKDVSVSPAAAPFSAPGTDPTSPNTAVGVVVVPEEYDYEMQQRMTIDDFDLLKVIGRGSFGKVMLVRECRRGGSGKGNGSHTGGVGKLYALKSLRKAALVKRNQIQHTATERTILQQIRCPFLVHLVYAFQTVDKLYMALDYVGGGELFFWLRKEKRFSELRCRLYVAELALGLSALHEAHIVYRDLKPENILLDRMGHLKLTDFGLSKSDVYTHDGSRGTYTFCGTPEYISPEMLTGKVGASTGTGTGGSGHGFSVDWWALGTLLYEMLVGLPPFYDKNVQIMYKKILKDPLRFPRDSQKLQLSEASKQFMRRLLDRQVSTRLGNHGIDNEFVNMPFFAGMQFTKVYKREYPAQFVPPNNENEDEIDVRNFDEEFTVELAKDSLVTEVEKMTSTMEEKSAFVGFSYMPAPLPLLQGPG